MDLAALCSVDREIGAQALLCEAACPNGFSCAALSRSGDWFAGTVALSSLVRGRNKKSIKHNHYKSEKQLHNAEC